MRGKLTKSDIEALLANPDEDMRADVARKIGSQVEEGHLTGQERIIANDILRIMVRDVAVRVREALAHSIAYAENVPSDVVKAIGSDHDPIAVPFLEVSPSVSDEDLCEIVRSGSEAKAVAVAGRAFVAAEVSEVIAETAGREAVERLVRNSGAEIGAKALNRVIDRYGDEPSITDPMAERHELPLAVAERLISVVSDKVRERLMSEHELSGELAAQLAFETRERATIGLLDGVGEVDNLDRFVEQLYISGRLTPTLIVRAACVGEMRFVEQALARLARIPVERAWTLVHDAGRLGLRALFVRAGLPNELYPVMRIAVDVYHETDFEDRPNEPAQFRRTIIERVLTQYEQLEGDDIDYLLYQISRQAHAADAPVQQAASA